MVYRVSRKNGLATPNRPTIFTTHNKNTLTIRLKLRDKKRAVSNLSYSSIHIVIVIIRY